MLFKIFKDIKYLEFILLNLFFVIHKSNQNLGYLIEI